MFASRQWLAPTGKQSGASSYSFLSASLITSALPTVRGILRSAPRSLATRWVLSTCTVPCQTAVRAGQRTSRSWLAERAGNTCCFAQTTRAQQAGRCSHRRLYLLMKSICSNTACCHGRDHQKGQKKCTTCRHNNQNNHTSPLSDLELLFLGLLVEGF